MKRPYCKITRDGQSCTTPDAETAAEELRGHLQYAAEGDDDLTVTIVWMTQDEYEAMPEFQGW